MIDYFIATIVKMLDIIKGMTTNEIKWLGIYEFIFGGNATIIIF